MKVGMPLLVQVKRDFTESKGAKVSTHISLNSRFIVFMPNTTIITISQKIEDEQEKERLTNERSADANQRIFLSDLGKFVIFKFQLVAHIHAERQQGDGNLGDNTGVLIFDIGIVTADINDGADHTGSFNG